MRQARAPATSDMNSSRSAAQYAEQKFIARLFADDGTIVVEQPIDWLFTRSDFGDRSVFKSNALATTENGRPAAVPYAFINGEVTVSAADPWMVGHQMFLNAALSREGIYGKERLAFVPDPLPVGVGCEAGPEPTDAAALAQAIQSDPDLQATSPVDAVIGGAAGMYMDISIAPGASLCVRPGSDDQGLPMVVTSTRRNIGGSGYPYGVDGDWGSNLDPADRMRLYLVNLPQGLTTRILAIAVAAPKDQFDEVLEAAAPVLQSIEFHAP